MMIYGSLQAEFIETKHGHIHKYGIIVFGYIAVYVS